MKKNILIVDEISENINMLESILQAEGYQVSIEIDGQSAFISSENNNYDLILLDIMMPKIDGIKICQKLMENPKTQNIPVIFLTERNDIESITKGFESGGVDYITKPFHTEELIARIKTHLKLKQIENEYRELNATKDKFFSIIAHDLRGPISTIQIALKGLRQKIYSPDVEKEVLEELNEITNSTFTLLDNLLFWAKSQKGYMNPKPQNIEFLPLLTESINFEILTNKNKNISFNLNVDEKIYVYADCEMLKVVLRNLISNALKFTENGGKILILALEKNDLVEISIIDNGIAMSPEKVQKLFKISERVKSDGTNGETGSGLGLILCYDFIKKNHGQIWVESEQGKGSKFTFTMPKKHLE